MPPKPGSTKAYAKYIISTLEKEHPDATISLDYRDPLQLLVSTILSAVAVLIG